MAKPGHEGDYRGDHGNGYQGDHGGGGGPQDGVPGEYVLIAGVVGVVALVGLVAVAIMLVSGGDGGSGRGAAAGSPTKPGGASPAASGSASRSPSATAGPVVRWRGALTLDGPRSRRDLDTVPPRLTDRDEEPDIRGDWLKPLVEAENDTQVVRVKGRPGAVQCRDAAATEGTDEVEVNEGDVVCVLTAAGRVARLSILEAHMTSADPLVRARVVIWDMPGAGQ
ncbi:hypothetical protein [Spirillospora sp. CA-128828]|uniref:hypothetical protein n=1 Tax=Spirillospora sp. CA-128828 TaxID=3240033 RepID=UPI003D8B688D